jgi:hypothetical protein
LIAQIFSFDLCQAAMPGAFLKGNVSFPGSFFVDQLSHTWNQQGKSVVELLDGTAFRPDSKVEIDYFRLRRFACLSVLAVLHPSTTPYTGIEQDTHYIYTGQMVFPEKLPTEARIRIRDNLAASACHFENVASVSDVKTGVFFNRSADQHIGSVHINGILDSTQLVLTNPIGFLPNHVYEISATLMYEVL